VSLLLDALKKAEQAKQAGAGGAPAEAPGPAAETPSVEPLMTRDRLPDISGLELAPDDLTPPARPAAPRETRPLESPLSLAEPDSAPPPVQDRRARGKANDENTAARDAVRQVFEAKQMDYNPRRPFYIALGGLAAVAVGAAGYFWWQLQPKTSFAVAKAPPAAVQQPAQPPAAPQPTTPPVGPSVAVGPLPEQAPSSAPGAASAPAPTPAAQTAAATRPAPPQPPQPTAMAPTRPAPASTAPARSAGPRPATPAADAPARVPVSVSSARGQIDTALERGYAALQAGDLQTARQAYSQALRADPSNRDALLGLAAIDARTGNVAAAEARYQRVLDMDPRDPYAQAGLAGLRGQADPVQSESRIKTLMASQPESAQLQFALGNQLAAQARWGEAQAAYFKAFAAEPENADFAYNLAVSLDHLRQPRLALEYYQRALALSANRPVAFDRAQANARAQELGR
jgi:tetratricopeptide (TPR) repeat protein